MTFEEYMAAIGSVHDQLQAIADCTANQAILGIADQSNPLFVDLMRRHAQLTKLSSELTERMISQMKVDV